MKKIILVLILSLGLVPAVFALTAAERLLEVSGVAGGGDPCAGTLNYFGSQLTSGTQDHGNAGYVFGSNKTDSGCDWQVPGSGSKTLCELTSYTKSGGGTPGNVRLVVYDNSGNLLCQGAAKVSVSSTSYGWYGHIGQANITPNPCTLTGGNYVKMMVTFDGNDTYMFYTPAVTNCGYNTGVTYANDGFPSTYPTTFSYYTYSWRGGVN